MNADGFAKAIRDIWNFLIPPLINLFFLGAVIESTFGKPLEAATAPRLAALMSAGRTAIIQYINQSSELVQSLISLFPGVDAKAFVQAAIPTINGVGSFGWTFVLSFSIVILAIAILVNYMTLFLSSLIVLMFAILRVFLTSNVWIRYCRSYLNRFSNTITRLLDNSVEYISTDTPQPDKYTAYAEQ